MKVYIGFLKDTNKTNVSVLTITDNNGVTLYNAKKLISDATVRFESDLISLKWGILQIKKLMQNDIIPKKRLTIFISNKTIYSWLDKGNAPLDFMPIYGDIMLELSFMDCESEIILSNNVDSKLKLAYKKLLKESSGTKVSDLFKNI